MGIIEKIEIRGHESCYFKFISTAEARMSLFFDELNNKPKNLDKKVI